MHFHVFRILLLVGIVLLETTTVKSDSLTTSLFSGIVYGIGYESSKELFSYALSSIGIDSSACESYLSSISSELSDIETALSDLSTEIGDLESAIEALDCDTQKVSLLDAISSIETLQTYYSQFLANKVAGDDVPVTCDSGVDGPSECLIDWAACALGSSIDGTSCTDSAIVSLESALDDIDTALQGNGLVSSCVGAITIPAEGEFETDYWDSVYDFMEYYYNYQAQGLLLLTEAYHLLAWYESGITDEDPSDMSTYESICSATTSSQTNCDNAIDILDTVYNRLLAQYQIAGVPYTGSDNYVVQYTSDTEANLFPSSLEVFEDDMVDSYGAYSNSCSTPLTASDACGWTTSSGIGATTNYDGLVALYFSWGNAGKDDLNTLLDGFSDSGYDTNGDYLSAIGFSDMSNKVFYSLDTHSFSIGNLDGTMSCFFDTDASLDYSGYVMCGSTDAYELAKQKSDYCYFTAASWTDDLDRNGFYDMEYGEIGPTDCTKSSWTTTPGWSYGSSQEQFVLPKISLSGLSCDEGYDSQNPGGAYVACNSDLISEILDDIIPEPCSSRRRRRLQQDKTSVSSIKRRHSLRRERI